LIHEDRPGHEKISCVRHRNKRRMKTKTSFHFIKMNLSSNTWGKWTINLLSIGAGSLRRRNLRKYYNITAKENYSIILNVLSTARQTVRLQFDISTDAIEIRAILSRQYTVWFVVDCTYRSYLFVEQHCNTVKKFITPEDITYSFSWCTFVTYDN
jgi:hypothetical protein